MKTSPTQALGAVYAAKAHCAIYLDLRRGCWVSRKSKLRLKGVRSTLSRECWPSYSYFAAERKNPTPASVRVSTGIKGGKRPQTMARRGSRRGRLVHQQLAMVAQRGFAAMRTHYEGKKRTPVHKFVRALCNHFEAQRWTLLASEVPVFNERFGSSIDLVARNDRTQRLVLIELKVGGDNYHRKSNAHLEGVLASSGCCNSPLVQAQAQLCAYRVLLERCYAPLIEPGMIGACCVVFVGESGVAAYPVDAHRRRALMEPLERFLYAASPSTTADGGGGDDDDDTDESV